KKFILQGMELAPTSYYLRRICHMQGLLPPPTAAASRRTFIRPSSAHSNVLLRFFKVVYPIVTPLIGRWPSCMLKYLGAPWIRRRAAYALLPWCSVRQRSAFSAP